MTLSTTTDMHHHNLFVQPDWKSLLAQDANGNPKVLDGSHKSFTNFLEAVDAASKENKQVHPSFNLAGTSSTMEKTLSHHQPHRSTHSTTPPSS